MGTATGIVLYGINRIFTVEIDGHPVRCRIKGKTLRSEEKEYNPLAPGDRVEIHPPESRDEEGLIVRRLPRRNVFWRWNRMGRSVQTMAANLDRVACVCAPESPPFRPRFIDRVEVISRHEEIPLVVLLNKSDTTIRPGVDERLRYYADHGVPVVRCSARTGAGMSEVEKLFATGITALVGQSGVGKSSLLNALDPSLNLMTGEVSSKYNRGTHVTNYGRSVSIAGARVIDTPGIREIHLQGLSPLEIAHGFADFRDFAPRCDYSPCTHTHEPGCAVKQAVEKGVIHPDRYESYRRILADIESSAFS